MAGMGKRTGVKKNPRHQSARHPCPHCGTQGQGRCRSRFCWADVTHTGSGTADDPIVISLGTGR